MRLLQAPGARRLFVAAVALAMAVLTFNLGLWQLRRADQKLALQAAVDSQGALDVVELALESRPLRLEQLMHRRVVVRGTWLAQHTVFLDNRPMNSRVGFHVVTPLRLSPGGEVLLVQRGWIPRDFQDRSRLPTLPLASGEVRVEGRLSPAPARLYDFGGEASSPIRQNLDPVAFSQEIGSPLLVASLLQSGSSSDGLLRDWPVYRAGVEKHHGYAFQWFALSGLIVLLYAWFQIVRPARSRD